MERREARNGRDTAHETRAGRRMRGFTLLELAIVITIIIILATIGVGRFTKSMEMTREAALRDDLNEMRKAIDNYTLDKKTPPGSLDDLKDAEYLRDVPTDPMTHQKDWNTEACDYQLSTDQDSTTGICNVRSSSQWASVDGSVYSTW